MRKKRPPARWDVSVGRKNRIARKFLNGAWPMQRRFCRGLHKKRSFAIFRGRKKKKKACPNQNKQTNTQTRAISPSPLESFSTGNCRPTPTCSPLPRPATLNPSSGGQIMQSDLQAWLFKSPMPKMSRKRYEPFRSCITKLVKCYFDLHKSSRIFKTTQFIKVKWVTANNFHLAVKGGGHSCSGFSSSDGGVVIDLSQLRLVSVDAERKLIMAGGGALWQDVDSAACEKGFATGATFFVLSLVSLLLMSVSLLSLPFHRRALMETISILFGSWRHSK